MKIQSVPVICVHTRHVALAVALHAALRVVGSTLPFLLHFVLAATLVLVTQAGALAPVLVWFTRFPPLFCGFFAVLVPTTLFVCVTDVPAFGLWQFYVLAFANAGGNLGGGRQLRGRSEPVRDVQGTVGSVRDDGLRGRGGWKMGCPPQSMPPLRGGRCFNIFISCAVQSAMPAVKRHDRMAFVRMLSQAFDAVAWLLGVGGGYSVAHCLFCVATKSW